jgi:hypothetical protein
MDLESGAARVPLALPVLRAVSPERHARRRLSDSGILAGRRGLAIVATVHPE